MLGYAGVRYDVLTPCSEGLLAPGRSRWLGGRGSGRDRHLLQDSEGDVDGNVGGKGLGDMEEIGFACSRGCRVAPVGGAVAPAKPILGKCPVLSRVTGVPAGLRAVPWPAPSLAARPATWLRPPVHLYWVPLTCHPRSGLKMYFYIISSSHCLLKGMRHQRMPLTVIYSMTLKKCKCICTSITGLLFSFTHNEGFRG